MVDDSFGRDGDEERATDEVLEDERGSEPTNPDYADYERDDGIVSIEDTTVHRDEDGNLLPRRQPVDELGGDIVAKPLLDTARERFVEDLQDADTDKEELSNADLAELFDTHIVEPDMTQHELCGDRVTERFVREGMTQKMQDAYYIGILLASDEYEMVARMRRVERGELTDAEVEMAMREQDRQDEQEPGYSPQGNRTEQQTRRERAEKRGGS